MNIYRKYDYAIGYSGHVYDEREFYEVYFKDLFKKLFNKDIKGLFKI